MTVHVNVHPVDGPQKPDVAFLYPAKEAGVNGAPPARPAQASRAPMQVFDTIRQQQQQQQQQ
jgi:hypothetical protein